MSTGETRVIPIISFERLLSSLRRWGMLVVAGALVAAITAFLVSRALPPEYEASAQLYIAPASNPTVAFQDVVLGTNVARSYVQLLTAEVVLRPAMERHGFDDLKYFKEHVRAAQVRDTSIITVSYRDRDAARAAATANAIADSFIQQTRELQTTLQGDTVTQLETQVRSVESDIKSLDEQITSLRLELAATPRPGASANSRAELQAQMLQLDSSRQAKQQTLAQLLKTRDDMRLAAVRAESTVSLWQPATPPLEAVSPRVALNTALGLISGALLALIAVLVVSYFEDRIVDIEEVHERLGAVALGQVHLGERPDSLVGKLFVRDSPRAPEAEAFRSLRTNIQFANVDAPPRAIVVTSALPREGKSVVSANLALAFATGGTPTILIDADLRRPSQHRVFGVTASYGLTSLLTDMSPPSDLERFAVQPNLYVIPSGPLPPNPAELLSSAKMSALIAHLQTIRRDATVIIDTSPVLAAADAVALSTKVDGVIFVVDSARTRSRISRHAVDALNRVRATILGVVLNKISTQQAPYYYYYGYYGGDRKGPTAQGRPQVR